MAKYLLPGTASPNWRLHTSENPAELEKRLAEADQTGATVLVKASMPDQLHDLCHVYVNPSRLGWWAVVEIPDPDAQQ